MSLIDDSEPVQIEGSVDPRNLRAELVRNFRTSCRYSLRQGLTIEELRAIVEECQQPVEPHQWAPPVPEGYSLVRNPELVGKGVDDRRYA